MTSSPNPSQAVEAAILAVILGTCHDSATKSLVANGQIPLPPNLYKQAREITLACVSAYLRGSMEVGDELALVGFDALSKAPPDGLEEPRHVYRAMRQAELAALEKEMG